MFFRDLYICYRGCALLPVLFVRTYDLGILNLSIGISVILGFVT